MQSTNTNYIYERWRTQHGSTIQFLFFLFFLFFFILSFWLLLQSRETIHLLDRSNTSIIHFCFSSAKSSKSSDRTVTGEVAAWSRLLGTLPRHCVLDSEQLTSQHFHRLLVENMAKEITIYIWGVGGGVRLYPSSIPNIPKMPFLITTWVLWRNKNKQ